jgi:hypothetical protein
MKKILFAPILCLSSLFLFAEEPVNEKVMQAFTETFKNAREVVWYEHPNSYEVKFKQNEIVSRVSYDNEGNIVRSIRYYYEDNLPLYIREKLKKDFRNKKIFGITELANANEINYFIVLEDDKNWFQVHSGSNGEISLLKKFNKA